MEGGIGGARLDYDRILAPGWAKPMAQMGPFSQRDRDSHLCYHARLRVGRRIWRGRRPTPFCAHGPNKRAGTPGAYVVCCTQKAGAERRPRRMRWARLGAARGRGPRAGRAIGPPTGLPEGEGTRPAPHPTPTPRPARPPNSIRRTPSRLKGASAGTGLGGHQERRREGPAGAQGGGSKARAGPRKTEPTTAGLKRC